MSRTSLRNIGRAYLRGRCATLKPPSPIQQHRTAEALRTASPEIAAAYAAGRAADPRLPLLAAAEVLGLVVQRLAGVGVEELPGGGA